MKVTHVKLTLEVTEADDAGAEQRRIVSTVIPPMLIRQMSSNLNNIPSAEMITGLTRLIRTLRNL